MMSGGPTLSNVVNDRTTVAPPPPMSVFTPQQLQALAYMPLDPSAISYDIQQVIYASGLLVDGYLVFKSTFLPRTVGVLLAIGGLCYLTYSFAAFLSPGFAAHLIPYIQLPSLAGEGSYCLWLLIGVNVQRWKEQASKASELDWSVAGMA